MKSWLYADQLEKPEEVVLFRSRRHGGLGLVNLQYKALSLLIRNFLETALNPKFQANQYHAALYSCYVENKQDMTCPPLPPYYDKNFFDSIRHVKEEGILNIKTMNSGMWYQSLLETYVTHQPSASGLSPHPCRIEIKHPEVDWDRSWSLAVTPGLSSKHLTFCSSLLLFSPMSGNAGRRRSPATWPSLGLLWKLGWTFSGKADIKRLLRHWLLY